MFTKIYSTIAIVLCCAATKNDRIFYGILMVIHSSVVSLFSRQKLCVFVSVVPFHLVKSANWFSFKYFVQWWPENILRKHLCFFFTSEKIMYRSNLVASFDFAVISGLMIIYTGNYTFPIAVMSVFRTKLYMQHLQSTFWFLTSYKRRLSYKRVSPSHERLTSKCSFYYKPVNY